MHFLLVIIFKLIYRNCCMVRNKRNLDFLNCCFKKHNRTAQTNRAHRETGFALFLAVNLRSDVWIHRIGTPKHCKTRSNLFLINALASYDIWVKPKHESYVTREKKNWPCAGEAIGDFQWYSCYWCCIPASYSFQPWPQESIFAHPCRNSSVFSYENLIHKAWTEKELPLPI